MGRGGGGGGTDGSEAWKMEAEREIMAQRHKRRQKYSRAAEERRISKITEAVGWKLDLSDLS